MEETPGKRSVQEDVPLFNHGIGMSYLVEGAVGAGRTGAVRSGDGSFNRRRSTGGAGHAGAGFSAAAASPGGNDVGAATVVDGNGAVVGRQSSGAGPGGRHYGGGHAASVVSGRQHSSGALSATGGRQLEGGAAANTAGRLAGPGGAATAGDAVAAGLLSGGHTAGALTGPGVGAGAVTCRLSGQRGPGVGVGVSDAAGAMAGPGVGAGAAGGSGRQGAVKAAEAGRADGGRQGVGSSTGPAAGGARMGSGLGSAVGSGLGSAGGADRFNQSGSACSSDLGDTFLSNYKSDPIVCAIQDFNPDKCFEWIFDCGATDTMTHDSRDIISWTTPRKEKIQTANGSLTPVMGADTIQMSPNLKVSNCLYVPSLSCKLLSISHVTRELNCTVLIYPNCCILQDIQTKEIIGRGTERDGLYYVDEVAQQGTALLAHGTVERQFWLWHRRLHKIYIQKQNFRMTCSIICK